MTLAEEFRTRNFSKTAPSFPILAPVELIPCSEGYVLITDVELYLVCIYGQWAGVLCIFLCFALGVANIFAPIGRIPFSIVCLCCAFIILFVEVPFLLRICPTSSKFDEFIRRFASNYMRALIYVLMSAVQWVSLVTGASSLIAAAVFLLAAALFYLFAGLRNQEFIGSKTLGGQGIAQMIV